MTLSVLREKANFNIRKSLKTSKMPFIIYKCICIHIQLSYENNKYKIYNGFLWREKSIGFNNMVNISPT